MRRGFIQGEIAFHYVWFTFTFHLNCYITKFPTYPRSDRNFSSLFISWHELFTKSRNIRLRVRHEIQNFSPFPILVQPSLADAHGTPVSIIYPLCTAMKRWTRVIAEPIRQYLPSIYGQKMQKYASQGTLSGSFMTLDLTGCLSEAGNDRYLQSSSHTFILQSHSKHPKCELRSLQ